MGLNRFLKITFATLAMFALSSCDLNPLGGDKSKLDPLFEPGKHIKSEPPTISAIPNSTMDENDIYTIPFTIYDPDTVLLCSMIFVKAYSSNETLIDSTGLQVGGLYPNCTLTMTPKPNQFGVANIRVEVYDFWTKADSTFQLSVLDVLTPGAFAILDATGGNNTISVTWGVPANMTGTSAHYHIFYRPFGAAVAFTQISNVTSPYTIAGLTNGVLYDVYVEARNSAGNRNSNTVQATPGRWKIFGAQFVPSSQQFTNTPGTNTTVRTVNVTQQNTATIPDANYPTIAYSAPENPINGPIAVGAPKPSTITTPSGRYRVYVNTQGGILSGAAP